MPLRIKTVDVFSQKGEEPLFAVLHACESEALHMGRLNSLANLAESHELDGVFVSGILNVEKTRNFVESVMGNHDSTFTLEHAYSKMAEVQEAWVRLQSFFEKIRPRVFCITEPQQTSDIEKGLHIATKKTSIEMGPKCEIYSDHEPCDRVQRDTYIKGIIKSGVVAVSSPESIHLAHKIYFQHFSPMRKIRTQG